ncbi:hypothetical protein PTKIN_Ptkin08bG0109400 [Pterospermum kingtungense]
MANVLGNKLSNVSLRDIEEEDNVVFVDEGCLDDVVVDGSLCLVGKMMSRKPFSLEAIRNSFMRAWQLSHDLVIKEAGDRLFLFRFSTSAEKARVFYKQPWSFDKSLVIVTTIDGSKILEEILVDRCLFWVQFHEVMGNLMSSKVGALIGDKLGKVLEVEVGRWIRARVELDVSKPLEKGGGGDSQSLHGMEFVPSTQHGLNRNDFAKEQGGWDSVKCKEQVDLNFINNVCNEAMERAIVEIAKDVVGSSVEVCVVGDVKKVAIITRNEGIPNGSPQGLNKRCHEYDAELAVIDSLLSNPPSNTNGDFAPPPKKRNMVVAAGLGGEMERINADLSQKLIDVPVHSDISTKGSISK